MKARTIGYWAATGLLALVFASSGMVQLMRVPGAVELVTSLGYPAYFATFLGAWKVPGAIAVLAPGLPRVKEWVYAGMVFNLAGAAFSHAVSGHPAGNVIAPLVLIGVAAASWALRPASRKLEARPASAAPASAAPASAPPASAPRAVPGGLEAVKAG